MSARLPRTSGRVRSAAAIAVTASTLVVGVGLSNATAATATPKAASAPSVKVAAKAPHAMQRVVFLFHSKFAVGSKSRWSVAFGDHYVVSGKGRPPAKVWHVFSASGRYSVRFVMVDAKGASHTAQVMVAVAKAVPGVTAPVGASGVAGSGGAVTTTLNGITVTTSAHPSTAVPSTIAPTVSAPSAGAVTTTAPVTVAPTTTPPVVIPSISIPSISIPSISIPPVSVPPVSIVATATPSVSIPSVSVPPVVAPVVNLLLGLNLSGLLHGTLLNFTTSTVQGSSAIATWAVTWGDGSTSNGTGTAPTALTHLYTSIGTHTARLTESAVDGATALSTNLVFLTI